ncbi:hypothetical protein Clacol_006719 [Clathrus columnatus]|uniref:Glucosamine 6-phosphate N-acetyltransferase n=1 Tax=Clathrus columnatus TaxID=1419009 RepID=A0AAV5AFP5_9AGAM|nr:hypothetical protein Clacol_006719 [Clathrus columnatus]
MPLTPNTELDLLFPDSLISGDVKRALHQDLHIRPLASTDYNRGHLSVLSVLTEISDPGEAAWKAQFDALRAFPETYYVVVILDRATDKIFGVGTLVVERKFTRGLGKVGHIEDIAVDKAQQGKKIGLRIINALTYISETLGCYKTILNCSESNLIIYPRLIDLRRKLAFYEKCGFEKKECEMVYQVRERARTTIIDSHNNN